MRKPSDPNAQPSTPPSLDSLAVITDRLRLLATRRRDMWWDIGRLLDEIDRSQLARVLGFGSTASFAHRTAGIQPSEARKLQRVAHCFSRDTAMRFGLDKLDLLLQILDASRETTCGLDPLRVEIPSSRADGTIAKVPFNEATISDLTRALRSIRRRCTDDDRRLPIEVSRMFDAVEKGLRAALGKRAPRVKIFDPPGEPNAFRLAIVDLDPATLRVVGRALMAASQPPAARKSVKKRAKKR